jgi:hypothetical protein
VGWFLHIVVKTVDDTTGVSGILIQEKLDGYGPEFGEPSQMPMAPRMISHLFPE